MVKMTHRALMLLVVFVRQFMTGIGFLVKTFRNFQFFQKVLHPVPDLHRHGKSEGCKNGKMEYPESGIHSAKVRIDRASVVALTFLFFRNKKKAT